MSTPKTLDLESILLPDRLATLISEKYISWDSLRQKKLSEWREIQQYVFATDTTKTSNSKNPWSNRTTLPKLCQIRDNLAANYMAALFPKQKWVIWEGNSRSDEDVDKKKAIESYMYWTTERNEFKNEIYKLVLDYIDYGNVFTTPDWIDRRSKTIDGGQSGGYVGPLPQRISPLDIVFDPTASTFEDSPKIIRSIISIGEVEAILHSESINLEEQEDAQALLSYLRDLRTSAGDNANNINESKNDIYRVAGFDSFSSYLSSSYAEILTFYGNIYDIDSGVFLKNQVIKIIDRHKILSKRVNSSIYGHAPIFHCGWRVRPDNLWAMGPLDNLVGMQYRIDHLENLKADMVDITTFPLIKIKGYVEDFTWRPMERIYVGDDGDVSLVAPNSQTLMLDSEIDFYTRTMEEMAGSPKEAMGFRTPGEKTKYEVQRLENAAGRIFQAKITYFEQHIVENLLNSMLELARRRLDNTSIRVFDDALKIGTFRELSRQDLTGNGRLKPVAARHFAEQASRLQDINNFLGSPVGQDPEVRQHFSSVELAKLHEQLLDLENTGIVVPYIRLTEAQEATQIGNAAEEQSIMSTMTPSGLFEGDSDI